MLCRHKEPKSMKLYTSWKWSENKQFSTKILVSLHSSQYFLLCAALTTHASQWTPEEGTNESIQSKNPNQSVTSVWSCFALTIHTSQSTVWGQRFKKQKYNMKPILFPILLKLRCNCLVQLYYITLLFFFFRGNMHEIQGKFDTCGLLPLRFVLACVWYIQIAWL